MCNRPHDVASPKILVVSRMMCRGGMNKNVVEGGIGVFKARVGKWWVVIGILSY